MRSGAEEGVEGWLAGGGCRKQSIEERMGVCTVLGLTMKVDAQERV